MTQRRDFRTERFGPENPEMAQAANSEDRDVFSWSAACADEGGIGREAGAHHGACFVGGDGVWDWEDELFVHSGVRGVAALGEDLVAGCVGHGFGAVA